MKKLFLVFLSIMMAASLVSFKPVLAVSETQAIMHEDEEDLYWERQTTYFICFNYDRNKYSSQSAHTTQADKVNTKNAIKSQFFRLALQACIDKKYFNSDIYDYNYSGECLSRNMANPTTAFVMPSGKLYAQVVEDYVNASHVYPYNVDLSDRQDAHGGSYSNFLYFKNLASDEGTFTFPVTLDICTLSEEADKSVYDKAFQFKTMVQEISHNDIRINLIEFEDYDDFYDEIYWGEGIGDADISYYYGTGLIKWSPESFVRDCFGHTGQIKYYMNLNSADIIDEIGYRDMEYYAEAGANYAAQYPDAIEIIYDRYAKAEAYLLEMAFAIPYKCGAEYYSEGIISYYAEIELNVGETEDLNYYTRVSNDINDWAKTYVSDNPAVAAVNSKGEVTGKSKGNAMITISVESGDYVKILVRVDNPKTARRVYGNDRYTTSLAVAETLRKLMNYYKYSQVVIARGDEFADALAGSYLAACENAPILLVDGKESRINRLVKYLNKNMYEGGTVYLLGGEAAVPASVEQRLKGEGYKVVRVSGDTRYKTNIEILKAGGVTSEETILVCSATDYPDALSVSSTGLPILLVSGDSLKAVQKNFLKSLGQCSFTIVGGPSAVSTAIQDELSFYGEVNRISGSSRWETAQFVAEQFFMYADIAVVAYGKAFPDGLCAGPLGYALGAPILLASTANTGKAKAFIADYDINSGFVIGGQNNIDDNAIKKIFGLSTADKIYEYKY